MSTLQYTPTDQIDNHIATAKEFYRKRQFELAHSSKPLQKDLQFRLLQLRNLYFEIKDHEQQITEALCKDFHRSKHESIILELVPLLNNILYIIKNLPQWMKPTKVRDPFITSKFSHIEIEKIALGTVLIISPFNFPLLLSLDPIAGALAGGNSIVFKPSELTPHISELMETILLKALEPGSIKVVQGEIPQVNRLLKSGQFDKIFYTGSTHVGTIVAQEAAKSLTPCTLELGGKSPVFITENLKPSHLRAALKRVLFGAFGNSGQICVAADYILAHESVYDDVISVGKSLLKELWPEINHDVDYTHMIHRRAYEGAMSKLSSTKGEKFTSASDVDNLGNLCIPPTLVYDVDWDDVLIKEENFSPLLPIIKYKDLDAAIDKVVATHDTPLVQYIFSDDNAEIDHILYRIRSGGCVIGDTVIHVAIANAPFGGIGSSGYGNYHGKWSFSAFTHERTVMRQPYWVDFLLSVRYAPFTSQKTKIAKLAMENKPWFNRNGSKAWTIKDSLFFAVLGVLVSVAGKVYYERQA